MDVTKPDLKMQVLAYKLCEIIRRLYIWDEKVKRSMDWLIKRLIKVGARVSCQIGLAGSRLSDARARLPLVVT